MNETQPELPWETSAEGTDGLSSWYWERDKQRRELSGKLGMPLGAEVEVVLVGGIRLRGRLELADENLWIDTRRDVRLQLRIGACTFGLSEVETCVVV